MTSPAHSPPDSLASAMNILVIDNYDSFTWNIAHLVAGVTGRLPAVVLNDSITLDEITRSQPDAIILSPGPGHPANPRDLGICQHVLKSLHIPVLGICLGHQALACFAGAAVLPAPELFHGRSSVIHHHGSGLFEGLPQPFSAIRYHSFAVATPLPTELVLTAWTDPDSLPMGIRHRCRPFWGVQFHPESVLTEGGDLLMRNFLRLARCFAKAA